MGRNGVNFFGDFFWYDFSALTRCLECFIFSTKSPTRFHLFFFFISASPYFQLQPDHDSSTPNCGFHNFSLLILSFTTHV